MTHLDRSTFHAASRKKLANNAKITERKALKYKFLLSEIAQ